MPQAHTSPLRLLFICKRSPQDRDLFARPYGRFFNLPYWLSQSGHDVTLLLAEYGRSDNVDTRRDGMRWISRKVGPNPVAWLRLAHALTGEIRPNWIVGLSDTWYGIIARRLAASSGARCAIDAYDNYESYMPFAWPLHWAWRRSLSKADLVTAAGQPLLDHMLRTGFGGTAKVVQMAADPCFRPMERNACRARLGLDSKLILIGYTGSLHRSRDSQIMLRLMNSFRITRPDVRFILSGRRLEKVDLPDNAQHLGYLDDEDVPLLINSMNLLISVNRTSSFGEHSYPVKLYEAAACGIPFVAASTKASRWMLGNDLTALYTAGDLEDLTRKVHLALADPPPPRLNTKSWKLIVGELEESLRRFGQDARRSRG